MPVMGSFCPCGLVGQSADALASVESGQAFARDVVHQTTGCSPCVVPKKLPLVCRTYGQSSYLPLAHCWGLHLTDVFMFPSLWGRSHFGVVLATGHCWDFLHTARPVALPYMGSGQECVGKCRSAKGRHKAVGLQYCQALTTGPLQEGL